MLQSRPRTLPNLLLRPYGIVLASVLVSILAWSLPDLGIRTGFIIREPITVEGVLILTVWYGLIILMAAVGFRAGGGIRLEAPAESSVSLSRPFTYKVLSVFAWTGVASSYLHVAHVIGLSGILSAISRNTVNDLKDALYTDYTIGFYSLRYLVALAGGVALSRYLASGRPGFFDMANLAALVGTAAISSRLSLIWAVVTGLSLWAVSGARSIRVARWRLGVLASTIVIVLWVLNHSRNAHFYAHRGGDSIVTSGLGEIRAYLGTPFQVALGVANHLETAVHGVTSHYYVEWEVNLSSNSAFDELIPVMGLFAFPYIGATAFVYSFAARVLIRLQGTYLFLGYPVILYAFAELWRVDLFRQGIFYTNLFGAIGIPAVVYLLKPCRARYKMTVIEYLDEPSRPAR